MPAISAGVFGYPLRAASAVIVAAVEAWLEDHPDSSVREIRLVGFDRKAAGAFATALEAS